jgi:hypothetical protein
VAVFPALQVTRLRGVDVVVYKNDLLLAV